MHEKYASCIQACYACAGECNHCAAACLQEDDVASLAHCIATDIDCAQVCRLCASLMQRGSTLAADLCNAYAGPVKPNHRQHPEWRQFMHIRRYLAGTVGVVALSLALFTGLADIKDGTSNTLGSVRALDGSSKEGAYIARVPVFPVNPWKVPSAATPITS